MTSYEEGLPDEILPYSQFQVVTFHKDRSSSIQVWNLSKQKLRTIEFLLGDPDGEAMVDARYGAAAWDAGSPGMSYMSSGEQ